MDNCGYFDNLVDDDSIYLEREQSQHLSEWLQCTRGGVAVGKSCRFSKGKSTGWAEPAEGKCILGLMYLLCVVL